MMKIRWLFDSSRRSKLVKKILTRFAVAKKQARSEGTQYRSPRIYLPTKLTDDSSFPFKEGDLLIIRVDGRKLIVQKAQKSIQQSFETGDTRQKP
jgi:hypothetical protein